MSNELVKSEGGAVAVKVTQEDIELVRQTVFPDSTDAELKLFFHECMRRGVHPLDRKIFPIKRNDAASGGTKLTFQTSIDMFRSEGLASDEYDGQDEPEYGPVDPQQGFPEWAKVAVYRKGISRPFVGIARWKEYYPGEKLGFIWKKMPHGQLAKCAEALAFRKAFPQKLGGLYASEELERPSVPPADEHVSMTGSIKELPQEKTAAAKNETPREALKRELSERYPDAAERMEALKKASIFGDPGKEKWIKDIEAASEKWCANALKSLREIPRPAPASGAEGDPEGCKKHPEPCDHSAWSDEGWFCSKTKLPCKYYPVKEGEGA